LSAEFPVERGLGQVSQSYLPPQTSLEAEQAGVAILWVDVLPKPVMNHESPEVMVPAVLTQERQGEEREPALGLEVLLEPTRDPWDPRSLCQLVLDSWERLVELIGLVPHPVVGVNCGSSDVDTPTDLGIWGVHTRPL